MDVVFTALLHASDPAWNCRRAYHIEAGRDLFGTWLVEVTFGRIGARGRTRTFVAGDEADARRIARLCLRRRQSAPRRIGVAYQLREHRKTDAWSLVEPPGGSTTRAGLGILETFESCEVS